MGQFVVSKVLDEIMWDLPNTEKLWPKGETVDYLNMKRPHPTYIYLIFTQIKSYVYLIRVHDKLAYHNARHDSSTWGIHKGISKALQWAQQCHTETCAQVVPLRQYS